MSVLYKSTLLKRAFTFGEIILSKTGCYVKSNLSNSYVMPACCLLGLNAILKSR